jgi:hypothetical protein
MNINHSHVTFIHDGALFLGAIACLIGIIVPYRLYCLIIICLIGIALSACLARNTI